MGRRQYAQIHFSVSLVDIEKLYTEISFLVQQAQLPILQVSRLKILTLHWKIGRSIVEAEYERTIRSKNHQALLSHLSKRLIKKFGKEFEFSNLEDCCKFYLVYPPAFETQRISNKNVEIPQLQVPLTWDHYRLLIHVNCPKARNFYEKEASNSSWSPSLLEKFIKNRLFERFSTSTNKESVLRSVQRGSLAVFFETT